MIEISPPSSWKDLQRVCAQILTECGLTTEVEKKLTVARGSVAVDVYALDPKAILPCSCVIECKFWRKRVPQSVIHSVRSVAADCGASHAIVVSSAGFQRGAHEAARFTSVKLFSYPEFESYFEAIWTDTFLRPTLYSVVDPLIEYTEPINSRIFRKADALPKAKRERFGLLRKQHLALAMSAALLCMKRVMVSVDHLPIAPATAGALRLPFAPNGNELFAEGFPSELRTTLSARRFLDLYNVAVKRALQELDEVFGERA